MKKLILLLFVFVIQTNLHAWRYFSEGTKWTEIRLDTLKYNSWYSKVGDEWRPNFETIEYYVQGEYIDERFNNKHSCIYTTGPEWADSLTLLIYTPTPDEDLYGGITVAAFDDDGQLSWPCYGVLYPLLWEVGTTMKSLSINTAGVTGFGDWLWNEYGTVEEIKEGDFGGVRPLKYSDVNGIRFIQGIGVASWNDGECLFGPIRPYEILSSLEKVKPEPAERHYRSMLVHFERGGEVLYDVWPEKPVASEPVTFAAGQMATIVLPTEPDAGKGKYYRLDRVEGNEIIFEQELQPRAHIPYIIVPGEDFCIELGTLDLKGLSRDTVSIDGVSFIGTYQKEEIENKEGFYIDIIDATPDCILSDNTLKVGALRAFLQVHWDDPYSHGGTKVPAEKLQIVLHDHGTGVEGIQSSKFKIQNEDAAIFDLSGRKSSNRKLPRGIYIEGGRKTVKK